MLFFFLWVEIFVNSDLQIKKEKSNLLISVVLLLECGDVSDTIEKFKFSKT
jgi:hypothetical protein